MVSNADFSRSKGAVAGTAFLAIPAVLLLVVLYGVSIEPRFLLDVRESSALVPNVKGGWDGAQIVVLGDPQTGTWLDNDGMVERAVEEAVRLDPDLILLTGDLLYGNKAKSITRAVDMGRPLAESRIPTYAVLGNHDCSMTKPQAQPNVARAEQLEREL